MKIRHIGTPTSYLQTSTQKSLPSWWQVRVVPILSATVAVAGIALSRSGGGGAASWQRGGGSSGEQGHVEIMARAIPGQTMVIEHSPLYVKC